jgi:hypothetical protein
MGSDCLYALRHATHSNLYHTHIVYILVEAKKIDVRQNRGD